MADFDVVVIGAGPAGCYAALTAAKNGCRTALFEEHLTIGWPRHDPGWLIESEFSRSMLRSLGKTVAWTKVREYRLCKAESGEVMEKSRVGGFLIRRDLLEKEIAARAVEAGVKLYLKSKITRLVRRDGRVEAVETNSGIIPIIGTRVVICADGLRSPGTGFAAEEGLCPASEVRGGTSYLLANADVSPGVIEHFVSSDPLLNYRFFFPHSKRFSYFVLPSTLSFQELVERRDNVISRKIRNACAIEIGGYGVAISGKCAQYFKRVVKDNIMFVGEASGGSGCIHGMIQGKFAGMVAASAIKENDVGERRLSEYQDSVERTVAKVPFFWLTAREDFGSFDNWFRAFIEVTRGIEATESADSR